MSGADLSTNRGGPVVDFTSQDFDALKTDLISYVQANYSDRWTDFNDDQFAVVLADLMAYLGDLFTFQMNATMGEAFARVCIRRQNLANIGSMIGYAIPAAEAASVDLTLTLDPAGTYPFTITPSDNSFGNEANGDSLVIFQPAASVVVPVYPGGGTVDVACLEGERFESVLIGVSTGGPQQRWQFPQQNVILDSIAITVGVATWTRTANFATALSTDTVFKIVQTDDGNTYAVFGDGVFGSLPALSQEIRATFRVGGGRRGNLNPLVITKKISTHANISSVTNAERSSGGKEQLSIAEARNEIPATMSTQDRCVTHKDYEDEAAKVVGVAKARAFPGLPVGQRIVRICVAPNGGGVPTATLKSAVITALRGKKMVTNRIQIFSPTYKSVRFDVLLHVNQNYRAVEVAQLARSKFLNVDGTGVMDFEQLNFGALQTDSNGTVEYLLNQTRLQDYFGELKPYGLDRAEILQLDVTPEARARDEGNSGNGNVFSITTNGQQRRRQYYILMRTATTFRVYERVVGIVSSLTDSILTDDEKVFEDENSLAITGNVAYSQWRLVPYNGAGNTVNVYGASGQDITVSGYTSLFSLTEPGAHYYLYAPPRDGTVGVEFVSLDQTVRFTVTAGSTAFVSGDAFTLDVFPNISDLRLLEDEFPQVAEADFITRSSGGSKT